MGDIIKRPHTTGLSLAEFGKERELDKAREVKTFGTKVGKKTLQIVFAFDTTASMYPYFESTRQAIARIVREIKAKHADSEFCVIAYKNTGDEHFFGGEQAFFSTGFQTSPAKLESELMNVGKGGGAGVHGDCLCVLEDVFQHLGTFSQWKSEAIKALVIIGDTPPHGYPNPDKASVRKTYRNDYRKGIASLVARDVKIYSVFCYDEGGFHSRKAKLYREFYKYVASEGKGKDLDLGDVDELIAILIAIGMVATDNLHGFEAGLESRGLLTPSVRKNLLLLQGGEKSKG